MQCHVIQPKPAARTVRAGILSSSRSIAGGWCSSARQRTHGFIGVGHFLGGLGEAKRLSRREQAPAGWRLAGLWWVYCRTQFFFLPPSFARSFATNYIAPCPFREKNSKRATRDHATFGSVPRPTHTHLTGHWDHRLRSCHGSRYLARFFKLGWIEGESSSPPATPAASAVGSFLAAHFFFLLCFSFWVEESELVATLDPVNGVGAGPAQRAKRNNLEPTLFCILSHSMGEDRFCG